MSLSRDEAVALARKHIFGWGHPERREGFGIIAAIMEAGATPCADHGFAEHIAGQLHSPVRCGTCGAIVDEHAPAALLGAEDAELCKRLRDLQTWERCDKDDIIGHGVTFPICEQAADRIAALSAQVAAIRGGRALWMDSVRAEIDDAHAARRNAEAQVAAGEADRRDAERWRQGVEDGEFPICRHGEWLHVDRAVGGIHTGDTANDVMDTAIASSAAQRKGEA